MRERRVLPSDQSREEESLESDGSCKAQAHMYHHPRDPNDQPWWEDDPGRGHCDGPGRTDIVCRTGTTYGT